MLGDSALEALTRFQDEWAYSVGVVEGYQDFLEQQIAAINYAYKLLVVSAKEDLRL